MKRMVLGFALDLPNQQVLLIRKNRPDWQAGKLNGVGGHMEGGDGGSTRAAMRREFLEETGAPTLLEDWRYCGTMQRFGKDLNDKNEWTVSVYAIDSSKYPDFAVQQTTDEEPQWVNIDDLKSLAELGSCLENIPVLVTLCTMPVAQPSNSVPRFTLEY